MYNYSSSDARMYDWATSKWRSGSLYAFATARTSLIEDEQGQGDGEWV